MCNSVKGVISEDAKPRIASDITDIHCELTGAPRTCIHVFFFDDAPKLPIAGKSVFLFGSIHHGLVAEQKSNLVNRISASILAHTGIPTSKIVADTADIPASWVMESSDSLPEPGEEETSLAGHKTAI